MCCDNVDSQGCFDPFHIGSTVVWRKKYLSMKILHGLQSESADTIYYDAEQTQM